MTIKLATVVKQLSFDSAHFLLNPSLSRDENIAKFHKCCLYKKDGTEEPHGHTYHLHVYVTGFVSEEDGFIIDFKELKRILIAGVIETFDHRLINNIPYFKDTNTLATVENILHYVWGKIQPEIDNLRPNEAWLQKIKMYETPDSFATLDRKQWEREKLAVRPSSLFLKGSERILTKEEFVKMIQEYDQDGN